MGIIRKLASVGTLGLVSYRNDRERSYRVAKQTRNAARAQVAQNQIIINNQRNQLTAAIQGNGYQMARDVRVTAAPYHRQLPPAPAGWYNDPTDGRALCFWDGQRWHPETKHYQLRA